MVGPPAEMYMFDPAIIVFWPHFAILKQNWGFGTFHIYPILLSSLPLSRRWLSMDEIFLTGPLNLKSNLENKVLLNHSDMYIQSSWNKH